MAYPALPHFAAPFAFGTAGVVNVVEQGAPEEIAAAVFNIAVCPRGFRDDNPTFGIADLAFTTVPIDTAALVASVAGQEPRASLLATESGNQLDQSIRTIVLQVGPTTV